MRHGWNQSVTNNIKNAKLVLRKAMTMRYFSSTRIALISGAFLTLAAFVAVSLAQTTQSQQSTGLQQTIEPQKTLDPPKILEQGNIMLSLQQEVIVPIAAFTANGDIPALKIATNKALDNGLTVNEAKEVIIQAYAYAGFPRSLNGLNALVEVLDSRKSAGKSDVIGRDITPIATNRPMLEIGTEIQTEVVGQPVKGGVYDFAPAIDQFLKSHLFGDIFARDILDYPTREVATIAILATIPGLEAQLQGHYNIGMNTGLTKEQLQQIVSILNANLGSDVGARAQKVLDQVNKQ